MADGSVVVVSIEERFVDLVLAFSHSEWRNLNRLLDEDEMTVLSDIVFAAGLKPRMLVTGKLHNNHKSQGGGAGEVYLINVLCPYKVVDENGEDHHLATDWLERAFQHVRSGTKEDRGQLIKELQDEIESGGFRLVLLS
jgi:hypothetical protein